MVVPNRERSDNISLLFKVLLPTPCAPIGEKMVARLRALTSYQNSTVGLVKGRNMLPCEAKNSKFFIYSGSALSSQASSQALLFETNLTG